MIGLSMGCIGFAVDWGITLLHDAKYQSTASVLKTTGTFCILRLALTLDIMSRGLTMFLQRVLQKMHAVSELSRITANLGHTLLARTGYM